MGDRQDKRLGPRFEPSGCLHIVFYGANGLPDGAVANLGRLKRLILLGWGGWYCGPDAHSEITVPCFPKDHCDLSKQIRPTGAFEPEPNSAKRQSASSQFHRLRRAIPVWTCERFGPQAKGAQRNAGGSADALCSLPAASAVTRGYTGQEEMTVTPSTAPQPCLINYNARLYDPNVARFLTPDSLIPDPWNGQSFN